MNFCKYCGTALKDDALFCPACGKGNLPGDVKSAAPQGIPPENIEAPPPPDRDYLKVEPAPKKRVSALTVILLVLLVLSLAANGWFAYKLYFEKSVSGSDEANTTQSQQEEESATKADAAEETASVPDATDDTQWTTTAIYAPATEPDGLSEEQEPGEEPAEEPAEEPVETAETTTMQ